jgi:hypothetical protein
MQGRIKVVALDIIKKSNESQYFNFMQEKIIYERILFLAKRITEIAEELKIQAPDSMWIIVWREYGIQGSARPAINIIPEMKDFFKNQMVKLTRKYPQLTIIAGTIVTKELITREKLHDIKKYYSDLQQGFNSEILSKNSQLIKHQQEVLDLEQNTAIKKIFALRNTCYIFFSTRAIRCHDKVMPYRENNYTNAVFQAAKKNNKNPMVQIPHPITKEQITIGIEICYEHYCGLLKSSQHPKPLLQFVLSASSNVQADYIFSDYLIHVDSLSKPRMAVSEAMTNVEELRVELYEANLFKTDNLRGPLLPVYPRAKQMLDLIDTAIAGSSETGKRKQLQILWEEIAEVCSDSFHLKLVLETNFKKIPIPVSHRLFRHKDSLDMEKLRDQLLELANDFQNNRELEINSEKDQPVIKRRKL